MLYFSYAANLNRSHMARLCPGAKPLFNAVLKDHTLTVRRWFNVELMAGSLVYGGVWKVRPDHLPRLDSYEDFPRLYERKEMAVLPLEHGVKSSMEAPSPESLNHGCTYALNELTGCFVYVMKQPFAMPLSRPDPDYLELVKEGCREWGIPTRHVQAALENMSGV